LNLLDELTIQEPHLLLEVLSPTDSADSTAPCVIRPEAPQRSIRRVGGIVNDPSKRSFKAKLDSNAFRDRSAWKKPNQ
jgi:hypothetical protein